METTILTLTLLVQILALMVAIWSVLCPKGGSIEHQQRKGNENEDDSEKPVDE
ncbi:MAG TPA: hypothetical protein VNW73_17655 [Ktedonobacteraceae bacterium]|jgi:hypothetical protein|nr:hypothetical protein [Ktedonobacteraceae bacterium]